MKQLLTLLFLLFTLFAFSQTGSFKKLETNDLRFRTMLNSDVSKFLTTDANGHVVLATVSGGGSGGDNFANADLTATGDRTHDFATHGMNINSMSYFNTYTSDGFDFEATSADGSQTYRSYVFGDQYMVGLQAKANAGTVGWNMDGSSAELYGGVDVSGAANGEINHLFFGLQPTATFLGNNSIARFTGSRVNSGGSDIGSDIRLPFVEGTKNIPITINGQNADANGNVTISATTSTTSDDIEITDPTRGVILHSASGQRWRLRINDSGGIVIDIL